MRVQLDVAHPTLLAPGEGETITDRDTRTVRIVADCPELTVTWSRYEPGERGPKPHIHRRHADAFYVLDGELAFGLGPGAATAVRAPAGTLVLAPQNVVHTFGNESDRTAAFLNIHAPSMGFGDALRARRDGRHRDAAQFDQVDPPADGGRSVENAVVRGPGEGEELELGPTRALFKAEVFDGEGTFSLAEATLAPGFPGPPPHRHRTHVDTFYVLDGTLTVRLGDEEHDAPPGSYAVIPPGTPHAFANRSDGVVRMLNLMAPGGFEQYLKDVARAALPGEPPDPRVIAEIASRYDFVPV